MMRLAAATERETTLSARERVVEGFQFVRQRPIRGILLLLGLVSVVACAYTVLMPIFADKILHGGARDSDSDGCYGGGRGRRGADARGTHACPRSGRLVAAGGAGSGMF